MNPVERVKAAFKVYFADLQNTAETRSGFYIPFLVNSGIVLLILCMSLISGNAEAFEPFYSSAIFLSGAAGLVQWCWILPLMWRARASGRDDHMRGLLVGSLLWLIPTAMSAALFAIIIIAMAR